MPTFEDDFPMDKRDRDDRTDRPDNRAAQEFMDRERAFAAERKRSFVNSREMVLDVICTLNREGQDVIPRLLKRRVLEARTQEEVRMAMDSLLVLAGFHFKSESETYDGGDEDDGCPESDTEG